MQTLTYTRVSIKFQVFIQFLRNFSLHSIDNIFQQETWIIKKLDGILLSIEPNSVILTSPELNDFFVV